MVLPQFVFGSGLSFPSQIPPSDLLNEWRSSLQNSNSMPSDVTQTEEIWDSSKGDWVTSVINPKVGVKDDDSTDFTQDPTSEDNTFTNTTDVEVDPDYQDELIQTEISDTLGDVADSVSQGDQDNDVPTLLEILAKLDDLDQDNDNELLQKILDELVKQNESNDLNPEEKDFAQLDFENPTGNVLPGEINLLGDSTPSGSMPNLTLEVPGINGPSYASINLTDPKYDTLYSVAKFGITAVFVFGSVRFTSWSAGQLLSS